MSLASDALHPTTQFYGLLDCLATWRGQDPVTSPRCPDIFLVNKLARVDDLHRQSWTSVNTQSASKLCTSFKHCRLTHCSQLFWLVVVGCELIGIMARIAKGSVHCMKVKMSTMFSTRFWSSWSLTMHLRDSVAVSNDESATVTTSQDQRCPTRNTSRLLSRNPKGVTQSVSSARMIHHECPGPFLIFIVN